MKGRPKRLHFNSISLKAGGRGPFLPLGALAPKYSNFPSIIWICHRSTAERHGSGRSQQRHHPQVLFSSFATFAHFFNLSAAETHPKFTFHQLPFSSTFIMPFIAPGTFAFLSKDYGEFSTGHFDPNRAYDPNSLGQLSKWRKDFLDGRYGSKQPSPPSTPRSPSPSFPIPVIVGNRPQDENWRQMFPDDDGYESEDDEILLPPPPIPPQLGHPPPNVPAVRVQPMHVGQQRLPLRDLPQFEDHPQNVPAVRVQPMQQPLPLRDLPQFPNPPPNVPAIRVQPMQQPVPMGAVPQFPNPPPNAPEIGVGPIHDGQQPMPLRVLPQIAHRPLNLPAVRVQPVQQPIPLRDVPLFVNPPPNVPVIRVQPMPQPLPLRDMPQIHHPPRNGIHVRQIQREYAVPQFAHPPPNVPYHPPENVPAIQPWQRPRQLRDVPLFDHPLPNGPQIHPNPPRVLEVIRRLGEWRGRPRDPRRPPQ